MSDVQLEDMRGFANEMRIAFGLPVTIHRPYGVTFQEWKVEGPNA